MADNEDTPLRRGVPGDGLRPGMGERYAVIAAIARRTADLVPHNPRKFAEPASIFEWHTRPRPKPAAGT